MAPRSQWGGRLYIVYLELGSWEDLTRLVPIANTRGLHLLICTYIPLYTLNLNVNVVGCVSSRHYETVILIIPETYTHVYLSLIIHNVMQKKNIGAIGLTLLTTAYFGSGFYYAYDV